MMRLCRKFNQNRPSTFAASLVHSAFDLAVAMCWPARSRLRDSVCVCVRPKFRRLRNSNSFRIRQMARATELHGRLCRHRIVAGDVT